MNGIGQLLIALGAGGVFTAVVSAFLNRRKLRADTSAVFTDTAVALIGPLRTELQQVRKDCEDEEAKLRDRMEDLDQEVRWLRRDLVDLMRRDRVRTVFFQRLLAWTSEWFPRARALGLEVPDPPDPPDLQPLLSLFTDDE